MPSFEPVRILVSHFDAITQAGLAASLRSFSGIRVIIDNPPNSTGLFSIVVADYERSLVLMARFAGQPHAPKVIVVTTDDREASVRHALRRGARGYLLQGCSLEELAQAIRDTMAGRSYVDAEIGRRLAESMLSEPLTARETDVLRNVVVGLGNKEIARQMSLSVHTVKSHLRAIYSKLDVSSRTGAVAAANQRGLLIHGMSATSGDSVDEREVVACGSVPSCS